MREEFGFMVSGVPIILSFRELDEAMQHRFRYEIVNIEERLVSIFDKRQHGHNCYLGKMKCADAVKKFS